jgi:hypothetical protein
MSAAISARLNSLRKKVEFETGLPEDIPQGLKPAFNLGHLRHE